MIEIIDENKDPGISFDEIIDFVVENSWQNRIQKKETIDNDLIDKNISWKLSVNFDKQKHLFFEKIKTDYTIEVYICSCGHTDFILRHPSQDIIYKCKECENKNFYNANEAWNRTEYFLSNNKQISLLYNYDIKHDKSVISSRCYIKIPHRIDFLKREVLFDCKPVYAVLLSDAGLLNEEYELEYKDEVFNILKLNLKNYMNVNDCFNIPKHKEKNITLDIAIFFLKHKYLKSFDFLFWNDTSILPKRNITIDEALMYIANYPKAKSIKKAIYQNYLSQIENNKKFNTSFIEIFVKNIIDINILLQLIQLQEIYPKYNNIDKNKIYLFVNLLKKHYAEKQILVFFKNLTLENENKNLFIDTIDELSYSQEFIENKFIKVPCKLNIIHNEFIRCTKEERYNFILNQNLEYSFDEKKPCISIESYKVKLPYTGKELFEWSEILANCISSYFEDIKRKEKIIYGVFENETLIFAVEITDNKIIQASAKYNKKLEEKNQVILKKWFKLFF